jgi:hypothetical protein
MIDPRRLAACLWRVTGDRGYIDIGAMDMVFGGGEVFVAIAKDLATYYNDETWDPMAEDKV